MADAIVGTGSSIAVGDGASPEAFTSIGGVLSISGLGITSSDIDTTNIDSTYRTFKQAVKELLPITLEIQFDQGDTQHQALRDNVGNNSADNYKISNSESPAKSVTVACYVQELGAPEYSVDGVITSSVTLRPSGTAPTWTDS